MAALLALFGCASKPAPPKKEAEKKPLIDKPVSVNADPGSAEVRSTGDLRQILYKVSWKKASVTISNAGPFASSMEGVSGSMYTKGKVASSFQAASAAANKADEVLKLYGGVNVSSSAYKMSLHCDSVIFRAKDKLIVASGNLSVTGANGVLSGPKEVWATPDLKVIATPEEFVRR